MDLNPFAVAIPAFFVLIGVELLWARARGRSVYRFRDAITDLSCGVTSQALGVLTVALTFGVYVLVFDRFAIWQLDSESWVTWVGAFVAVDLLYYWWHRSSHRVNALWAAHIVHHQSEDYNLAVALRQALFTSSTSAPFYLPLAILGVPPAVYGLCAAINTLYQFWIHTRLVGRLGPVEWVMNTPSHHRVHHGINPECIDRNHAGVFIVWDRLFGTFAPEPDEEPVYGTVAPLRSWNPLWANFVWWGHIWRLSRASSRWQDKLWAWFAPPEWAPAELGGPKTIPPASRETATAWDSQPYAGVHAYVLAWFVPMAALITGLIQAGGALAWPARVGLVAMVFATVVAWGALFEGRAWGLWLEKARLIALAAALGVASSQGLLPLWAAPVVGLALLAAVAWIWRMGRQPRAAPAPAQ